MNTLLQQLAVDTVQQMVDVGRLATAITLGDISDNDISRLLVMLFKTAGLPVQALEVETCNYPLDPRTHDYPQHPDVSYRYNFLPMIDGKPLGLGRRPDPGRMGGSSTFLEVFPSQQVAVDEMVKLAMSGKPTAPPHLRIRVVPLPVIEHVDANLANWGGDFFAPLLAACRAIQLDEAVPVAPFQRPSPRL